jgi:hypothetical protein
MQSKDNEKRTVTLLAQSYLSHSSVPRFQELSLQNIKYLPNCCGLLLLSHIKIVSIMLLVTSNEYSKGHFSFYL